MADRSVNVLVKARDDASRKFSKIGSSFSGMTSMLHRAALAVGLGSMGYIIKGSMDAIDATAKLSDRIGIATEDLLAYQHAGDLAGVSNEALSTGLSMFVRNLGNQTAAVREALTGLGIDDKTITQMSTSAAFEKVAGQLGHITSNYQKAAIAQALFGRGGMSMLDMIQNGVGGIEEARKEVESLGASYDRFSAYQVEQANDSITRLSLAFTGLKNNIAIAISPAITSITEQLIDMSSEHTITADTITEGFRKMTQAASYFLNTLEIAKRFKDPLGAAGLRMTAGVLEHLDLSDGNKDVREQQSRYFKQMADEMRQEAQKLEDGSGLFDPLPSEKVDQFFDNLNTKAAESKKQFEAASLAKKNFSDYNPSGFESMQKSLDKLIESFKTPFEKATEQATSSIEMLDQALANNAISLVDYMNYYNKVVDRFNAESVDKTSKTTPSNLGNYTLESNTLKYAPGSTMNYQKTTADNTKTLVKMTSDVIRAIKESGKAGTVLPAIVLQETRFT